MKGALQALRDEIDKFEETCIALGHRDTIASMPLQMLDKGEYLNVEPHIGAQLYEGKVHIVITLEEVGSNG